MSGSTDKHLIVPFRWYMQKLIEAALIDDNTN